MLKLIDRQMIRGYFKSYIVCLSSLLSLYIVVDLFTNLDDFTHHGQSLKETIKHIFTYYGYKIPSIFDKLCEVIVLWRACSRSRGCMQQRAGAAVVGRRLDAANRGPGVRLRLRDAEPGGAQSRTASATRGRSALQRARRPGWQP